MRFGEAFLSLTPTLDQDAVRRTEREAGSAGTRTGTSFGQGFSRAVSAVTDRMRIDDFGTKFEAQTQKVSKGSKAFIGAGVAVGGASAALGAIVPLAGGAAAALAPVAVGFMTIKTSMLAVKLTAQVVKAGTQEAIDAIGTGLTGTAEDTAKALKELPPQAQAFAKSVISIRKPLDEFKEQSGERLFAPINKGFDGLVKSYVPALLTKLPDLSGAVGEVGASFIDAAQKSSLLEAAKGYVDKTSESIKIAGKNIHLIPEALAQVVGASGRTLPVVAGMFDNLVKKVAEFITRVGKSGGLDRFLQGSLQNLKLFGQILGNVGSIFINTFKQMDTSGKSTLQTIADLTARVRDWVKSAEGQERIAAAFATMERLGTSMGGALGTALKSIGSALVAAAPVAAALATTFGELLIAVTPLLPYFTELATLLIKLLIPAIKAFSGFMQENETAGKILATTIGALVLAGKLYSAGLVIAATVTKASTVATAAWSVVTRAAAIASNLWSVATYAVGVAMRFALGPVGLVITAITALIAIVVLAYKNHEGFRNLVDAVWAAIKKAISAVADWFTKTAWPAMKTAIQALGDFFTWLWKNALVPAWNGIKTAIDVSWAAIKIVFTALDAAVKAIGAVFTWLWKNILVPVWEGIKLVVQVNAKLIEIIFKTLEVLIRALAAVFTWLWKNVIVPVWEGIKTAIQTVYNWLMTNIFNPWMAFIKGTFMTMWNAFKTALTVLWDAIKTMLTTAWNFIRTTVFDAVTKYITGPFMTMWNNFKTGLTVLWDALKTMLNNAWLWIKTNVLEVTSKYITGPFMTMWNNFKQGLTILWDALKSMLSKAWEWIKVNVLNVAEKYVSGPFMTMWNTFKSNLTTLWNNIKTMLSDAWNWVKSNVLEVASKYVTGPFMTMWGNFKTNLTNTWNGIKTMMSNAWGWLRDNVFTPIGNVITKTIPNAFNTGVTGITKAWEKLKAAVGNPVKFVVNTVLNEGVIKGFNWISDKVGGPHVDPIKLGFADGGVLPGYTPGKDVHKFRSQNGMGLELSGGEAIMRPEFTRAMGPAFINAANAVARSRGVAGVKGFLGGMLNHGDHPQYATGGIVQRFKDGGIFGNIIDGVKGAWDKITNPVDALKSGVSKMMGGLPGSPFMKDLLGKTVSKLMGSVTSWVTGKFESQGGAGGPLGDGAGVGRWQAMWNWVKTRFPHADLYSGYRNSNTLSGNKSLHASGRAIDVTPDKKIGLAIRAEFGKNITELIGPWPELDLWHGKFHDYSHAVDAQHGVYGNNAHWHWAMKRGGIFDQANTYDDGGWLNPGDIGINRGGKPEAVLNPAESAGLKAMGTDKLVDLLEELIEEVKANGHTVGGYIRGSGRGLVVKARGV